MFWITAVPFVIYFSKTYSSYLTFGCHGPLVKSNKKLWTLLRNVHICTFLRKPFTDPRLWKPSYDFPWLPIKSQLSLVFQVLRNVVTINLIYRLFFPTTRTSQASLLTIQPQIIPSSFFLACLHSSLCCFPAQLFAFNESFLWTWNTSLATSSAYYLIIWSCLNSETCYLHLKELSPCSTFHFTSY